MDGKTWTTPEELIEMTHWLSGAPGKRWVWDRSKTEITWGVGNAGMVGLVFGVDGECGPVHAWPDAAPYTFLRDDSEPKPTGKPVLCLGEPTFEKLRRGETVELGQAVLIPASDVGSPKPDRTEHVEAIVRRCEAAFERIARRVAREEVAAATTGPGYTLWPVFPGPETAGEPKAMARSIESEAGEMVRGLIREELAKAEVVKDTDGKLRIVTGGA